jgi:hypothetical protein
VGRRPGAGCWDKLVRNRALAPDLEAVKSGNGMRHRLADRIVPFALSLSRKSRRVSTATSPYRSGGIFAAIVAAMPSTSVPASG